MAAEKNFENKIKRYLIKNGIYPFGTSKTKMTVPPVGYYQKRWGGGVFQKSGIPDLQVVIRGRAFEFELKAPDGIPSELQKLNIEQINDSGGFGIVLYPKDFDYFKKIIEKEIGKNGK